MPEMRKGQRGSGGQITSALVDTTSLLPWLNGTYQPLKTPDQSRYGPSPTARTEPGRVPRWEITTLDDRGRELGAITVIGEDNLRAELEQAERRADLGGIIVMPL